MLFLNLVLLNGGFSAFFFNHFLTKYRVLGFHFVPYAFFIELIIPLAAAAEEELYI